MPLQLPITTPKRNVQQIDVQEGTSLDVMLQSLIKGQTCLDLLGYFTRQCLGDSCRPWSRFFHVLKAQRCHVTFGAQVSTPCRRTLQKVRLPPGWVELIVHLVGLVFVFCCCKAGLRFPSRLTTDVWLEKPRGRREKSIKVMLSLHARVTKH